MIADVSTEIRTGHLPNTGQHLSQSARKLQKELVTVATLAGLRTDIYIHDLGTQIRSANSRTPTFCTEFCQGNVLKLVACIALGDTGE
jgi:hypothetical protein